MGRRITIRAERATWRLLKMKQSSGNGSVAQTDMRGLHAAITAQRSTRVWRTYSLYPWQTLALYVLGVLGDWRYKIQEDFLLRSGGFGYHGIFRGVSLNRHAAARNSRSRRFSRRLGASW